MQIQVASLKQVVRQYPALLVTLLIGLAALLLQIVPAPISFIRVMVVGLLFYLVPGLLLWESLFGRDDHADSRTAFEKLSFSFVASLLWLTGVVGVLGVFVRPAATQAALAILASYIPLMGVNVVVRYQTPPPPAVPFSWRRTVWPAAIVVIVAIPVLFIFFNGGETGVDSWQFLQTAQQLVREDVLDLKQLSWGFTNSYAYPIAFIMVGLMATLADTSVVTIWFYLPVLLVLFSLSAYYNLAKALFKHQLPALISLAIFVAAFYYRAGFFHFTHLTTPDSMNAYILLPLFWAVAWRWAPQQAFKPMLFLLLLTIAVQMAIIHNSKYFFTIWLLVATALFHLLFWRKEWRTTARLILVAATLTLLFVGGFTLAIGLLQPDSKLSFLSVIASRNQHEFATYYVNFYPFPDGVGQISHYSVWALPLSLLMFLLARDKQQRLAATFIFTGLFLGALVFFQPRLWALAMMTIPKLNRFLLQLPFLLTPLAWGWGMSTASVAILAGLRYVSRRRKLSEAAYWGLTAAVVITLVLLVALLLNRSVGVLIDSVIFLIYPSRYWLLPLLALLMPVAGNWLRRRSHQEFAIDYQTAGEAGITLSAAFLILLLLLTPGHPELAINPTEPRSSQPTAIMLHYFNEPFREWWEPELPALFKEQLPPTAVVLTQCWPKFFLVPLVEQPLINDEAMFSAVDPRLELVTFVEALEQRHVEYILLTNGQSSWYTDICRNPETEVMRKNFDFLVPLLSGWPDIFKPVYQSPANVLFKVDLPDTNPQLAGDYWQEYQQQMETGQTDEAVQSLQLWAYHNPDPTARCTAFELAVPLVKDQMPVVKDTDGPGPGADIATMQAGTKIIDFNGFSARPDRAVTTLIDNDRFDSYAVVYADQPGELRCGGAWVTLDLGQPRRIQVVELEWDTTVPATGRLLYLSADGAWQPALSFESASGVRQYILPEPIESSQVRLALDSVQKPGEVRLLRLSLYESEPFTPPGEDIALLSAGTTVEDHTPPLAPDLAIESALDGDDLDGRGAVAGGPDEAYPHGFVLNFNQERELKAVEIQWLDRSYGQDWELRYFDGTTWQSLKREENWQPTSGYLYRYILPETVKASKIELQVKWTSGGRMAIRRFSVYGQ
jgi:hypothetical protein